MNSPCCHKKPEKKPNKQEKAGVKAEAEVMEPEVAKEKVVTMPIRANATVVTHQNTNNTSAQFLKKSSTANIVT